MRHRFSWQTRTTSVNYYSLSQSSPTTEGFGFYDQQYALLLASGVAKPNVRTQFVRDIVKFIQALQKDRHEIILSLDANETNGQDKVGIDLVLRECQLYDPHTIGPDDKPPATYPYGNHRRIDYSHAWNVYG